MGGARRRRDGGRARRRWGGGRDNYSDSRICNGEPQGKRRQEIAYRGNMRKKRRKRKVREEGGKERNGVGGWG